MEMVTWSDATSATTRQQQRWKETLEWSEREKCVSRKDKKGVEIGLEGVENWTFLHNKALMIIAIITLCSPLSSSHVLEIQ